jgi:hypothetical protein
MASLLQQDEEETRPSPGLAQQATSFFVHALLAVSAWIALMLVGYAINPSNVPQWLILLLSIAVPLIFGFAVNHYRQAEMASLVWLLGLIWFMIVALWILDMPTAPNQCFNCRLSEKLTRTFFSMPSPSGLIDNDGPFFGTWPATALLGYSIGARLALRRRTQKN